MQWRTGLGGLGGGVRRWWAALSLLAGVVLLAAAVLGLSRDRPTPSSFGAAPLSTAPLSAAPPGAAPTSAPVGGDTLVVWVPREDQRA